MKEILDVCNNRRELVLKNFNPQEYKSWLDWFHEYDPELEMRMIHAIIRCAEYVEEWESADNYYPENVLRWAVETLEK